MKTSEFLGLSLPEETDEVDINVISENFEKTDQCFEDTEVIFGVYTGDGTQDRVINLGFEPAAVEIYAKSGQQTHYDGSAWYTYYYGGAALKGYPCGNSTAYAIKIVENGFTVTNYSQTSSEPKMYVYTNKSGTLYYFKAYKTGNIKVIE